MAAESVSTLLSISTLGIYIHAMFLTISLGFPLIICALLFKWSRTRDNDYLKAVKTVTGVLGLNFALGAITGTLVEFGLVQAWPGSIFVISTFGFVPLSLEVVAFVGEIIFLLWFIVSLGKVKAGHSMLVMGIYFVFAALSGVLITSVNSWLNAPWGTGALASNIYPFLPQYGPSVTDPQALIRLKVALVNALLASGSPSQLIQDPNIARAIGITLADPIVALFSPYAIASDLHNVNAGIIVGMSFALAGFAYKFFRTGDGKYLKVIKAVVPIVLVLLILQPTVFGDLMGKAVATYDPTKFALMEGANESLNNPIVAFLGYGDPNHPIIGFDVFRNASESLRGTTVGELASSVIPNFNAGAAASIDLAQLGLSDLAKAETKMGFVNAAYYTKLVFGAIAAISILALFSFVYKIPILSSISQRLFKPLGQKKTVLTLGALVMIASIMAGGLGWGVREIGRKPWTIYGLVYPEEVISPVAMNPIVMAIFVVIFVTMAIVGIYGMYVLASRPLKFMELLRKGAGNQG